MLVSAFTALGVQPTEERAVELRVAPLNDSVALAEDEAQEVAHVAARLSHAACVVHPAVLVQLACFQGALGVVRSGARWRPVVLWGSVHAQQACAHLSASVQQSLWPFPDRALTADACEPLRVVISVGVRPDLPLARHVVLARIPTPGPRAVPAAVVAALFAQPRPVAVGDVLCTTVPWALVGALDDTLREGDVRWDWAAGVQANSSGLPAAQAARGLQAYRPAAVVAFRVQSVVADVSDSSSNGGEGGSSSGGGRSSSSGGGSSSSSGGELALVHAGATRLEQAGLAAEFCPPFSSVARERLWPPPLPRAPAYAPDFAVPPSLRVRRVPRCLPPPPADYRCALGRRCGTGWCE